jgi:hypothetical protein|tara:strand:- start:367 stop:834 length:468 start_codon:yes stop_codon:yes gene_type:complete
MFMVTFPSFGQSLSADKLTVIRELMEVTGAQTDRSEFSKAFIQQMISVLRAKDPTLPDRVTTIVTEEVNSLVAEELDNEVLQHKIYPIYANLFTLEELEQLVEFNRSPVGQKANQVMPSLLQQSMNAANQWSEQMAPKLSDRVLKRFSDEGIKIR